MGVFALPRGHIFNKEALVGAFAIFSDILLNIKNINIFCNKNAMKLANKKFQGFLLWGCLKIYRTTDGLHATIPLLVTRPTRNFVNYKHSNWIYLLQRVKRTSEFGR